MDTQKGSQPPAIIKLLTSASLVVLFLIDQLYYLVDSIFASILAVFGLARPVRRVIPNATFHPAVVISGASTGIGRKLALTLAHSGYHIFAGVRQARDGKSLLDEWNAQRKHFRQTFISRLMGYVPGGTISFVILDVAKPETIQSCYDEVVLKLGSKPLVAIISNAGIGPGSPMELFTRQELENCLAVNTVGAFDLVRQFLPVMRQTCGGGRVVFTSSVASEVTAPFMGIYTASKAALNRMAASLRMEIGFQGIGVSTIEPGVIATPIWDKANTILGDASSRPQASVYKTHLALAQGGGKFTNWIAVPPGYVMFSFMHALTSWWPLPRYPVGWDSWGGRILGWFVPVRVWEGFLSAPFRFSRV